MKNEKKNTRKKLVILGATGRIGAYLALYFKTAGYDVIACGHRKSDNGFFEDYGIEYLSINIENPKDFKKLPQQGVFAVLDFAGMLPASMEGYNGNLYISSIIQGTLNVLEYCRTTGVDRIIFPQSLFDISYLFGSKTPIPADAQRKAPMDGDHAIYVIAKNAAVDLIEHYFHAYGLKRFIFRLSRVYMYEPDPYTYKDGKKIPISDRQLIYKAMKGEPIEMWGDPDILLETVNIYDFTSIIEKALESNKDGGLYNIGSGGTTLKERIEGIVEVFSTENNKSEIIPKPGKKVGRQFVLDISKTKEELGYEPKVSWKEYLKRFKEEMELQRFEKIWGKESDFLNL